MATSWTAASGQVLDVYPSTSEVKLKVDVLQWVTSYGREDLPIDNRNRMNQRNVHSSHFVPSSSGQACVTVGELAAAYSRNGTLANYAWYGVVNEGQFTNIHIYQWRKTPSPKPSQQTSQPGQGPPPPAPPKPARRGAVRQHNRGRGRDRGRGRGTRTSTGTSSA